MPSPGTGFKPRRKKKIPIEHYNQVQTMLMAMFPMAEILKQAASQFQQPKAYVKQVIAQVYADWADDAVVTADSQRHHLRQSWQMLYRQANADKDWPTCTKVLTELGKLDGVYQPQNISVSHQGQVGVGISLGSLGFKSPQEVADRVEWLKAQIASKGAGAIQGTQPHQVAQAVLRGEAPDSLAAHPTTNGSNGVHYAHQESTDQPIDVIDIPPSDDEGTS